MIASVFNLSLLANLGLLAQMRRWRRLGDGLRGSGRRVEFSELLPYLIGLAIIALGIWAVVQWIKRNDTSQPCDDPWKLFRELCQAHDLNSSQGRLLRKLVEAWKMEQPAKIFVTPMAFEPASLPPSLQAEAQQLRGLRARLF